MKVSGLRRRAPRAGSAWVALAVAAVTVFGSAAATNAQVLSHDRVVSDDPSNNTPHVLDGSVKAIVQVGNTMIIAGAFSSVQAANGGAVLTRNNIVAFNATTGAFSTTFVPSTDGEVTSLLVAPGGQSVYAGGFFNTVNGQASKSLARISVSNGALVSGFRPPVMNGRVKDLRLASGQLWVAGTFSTVAGQAQAALATLNPATGTKTSYMALTLAGPYRGGALQVLKMDINAAASRLVAIGNFATVNGQSRPQLVMIDLTGPSAVLANWATQQYAQDCAAVFDSYMRDLDFSPDGSFFVISTTGAYVGGPPGPCDTTMRWETGSTGLTLQPSWVDYTGGDTSYAVAITGTAVYVGGHFRWQNNPFRGDAAGPGAVSREGIAALDPRNGLPLSWNPGRTKGVGVFDMLATQTGLWVGSDTDRIGSFEYHGKIAFLPLAGAPLPPADFTGTLPNHVFLAGGQVAGVTPGSVLYRVNTGGPALSSQDNGPDWAVDSLVAPDPHHSLGSDTAGWSPVPSVDGSVPAGTPRAVFDSERWDPGNPPEMEWDFAVTSGTPIEVRLYFASRCGCTSTTGSRVFDVSLDGTTVLNDYDIVATTGQDIGTMRAFDITSDGNVDIDFGHVVENPLINAIEIVRTDLPAPPPPTGPDDVSHRYFTGTTAGPTTVLPPKGVSWSTSRGSVMIDDDVFTAAADGSFFRRPFDGSTFGPATPVDTSDLLVRLDAWHNDASQITGMFFDNGRLYFTLAGSSTLFYRYLTPESDVVGAQRFTASTGVVGVDFSRVSGMFLADGQLYFATSNDGVLHRVNWANGAPVAGTATEVSGPAIDGNDWRARSLFLYTGTNLPGANQPPTAAFTVGCASLTCAVDGSGSSDNDGTIDEYAWNFGDGGTASGANQSHKYVNPGIYTITLTVTDDDNATDTASRQVTVEEASTPPVAFVGEDSTNGNLTSYTVTVPAGVDAGDGLVLVATTATVVTLSDPAGWQRVDTENLSAGNGVSVVWERVATAGDAGDPVTVTLSARSKAGVTVLAYDGTSASGPLSSTASAATTVSQTSYTTPAAANVPAGGWVVSYWAQKSSATTSWNDPAGEVNRSESYGTGGGRISVLATDSGAPVAAGTRPGRTATANSASARAVTWTFVLAPAS